MKINKNRDVALVGTIRVNPRGFGFIEPEENGQKEVRRDRNNDIFVPPNSLNTAFNGDKVRYIITGKSKRGFEGKVLSVISRARNRFVVTLEKSEVGLFGIADDKKIISPFFISGVNNDIESKKALVELISWKNGKGMPEARIIKILGEKGVHETEMRSIIMEKGFDLDFPIEVEKEASELLSNKSKLLNEEVSKRRDMRKTWTCTIDPVDAKDFDDAISFKEMGVSKDNRKMYEIGVHIADVSFFVRENNHLDQEAFKRGCSIYMVDRTIPMLPEILSNDLCSLNPGEDKLAFSAIFVIDENINILCSWFGKTIINSQKRFTYETAEKAIKDKDDEHHSKLLVLNELAKKLRKQKLKNGAIEFESDEVKFVLDDKGKPLGIIKKERLDSHKLVEEFMLLANKEVAFFLSKEAKKQKGTLKSIYRIHDLPSKEKISDLSDFLRSLGHTLHLNEDGEVSPSEINKLLSNVSNKPEAEVIRTSIIRSMQKAIYSTSNIGHFGLGFEHYTHFTSPIRRYPDLIIHRLLDYVLSKKQISQNVIKKLEKVATQSTEREISAAEAERDSIKYKQIEYMSERIGHSFEGKISGVTEWGIYIEEKDTKCEGLIKITLLNQKYNDNFVFTKKSMTIKGNKLNIKFRLGDTVKFRVVGANIEKRILDYEII